MKALFILNFICIGLGLIMIGFSLGAMVFMK